MNNTTFTQQGAGQDIIEALGLSGISPELKQKIVAIFGKILFKRLLLLLPDTVTKSVIAEITVLPLEKGMERLITLFDKHIPDAASRRSEILKETIAQFRLSQRENMREVK